MNKNRFFFLSFFFLLALALPVYAGVDLYQEFVQISHGKGQKDLFSRLNKEAKSIDWTNADTREFKGNLRFLQMKGVSSEFLYMVRSVNGELFILTDASNDYQELLGDKYIFKVLALDKEVAGQKYSFAKLKEKPKQTLLDRVFKISIVLMLFFVMVGMGLTLTFKDFKRVFQKPKGIVIGSILQWGIMPLIAVAIGHLLGFYETFPFIFIGMVLIAASPGGVTSNLMTYYGKGDLALSISLTSFSTVLSIFFTPLLLALYSANVPEVSIPVGFVVQTIIILVIIPLGIGMLVRMRWEKLATKSTPIFSALGIVALLFLMIAGVFSNIEVFSDTQRYGVKFYSMVFLLTFCGMLAGIVIPKLFKVNNYQIRAISLETGLRNASLAMAIALLIQDFMGDFYSSVFVTSAMFGLLMYAAGFLSIWLFKILLPVNHAVKTET